MVSSLFPPSGGNSILGAVNALKGASNGNPQALSGSDFLEACSNVPYPMLMRILDEHMSAMRVVYEKEYSSVVAKIRSLKQS